MAGCKNRNAYKDGSCCCNCRYQKRVNCHPFNEKVGKGQITELLGFVCGAPEMGEQIPVFFESQHGMCEMHEIAQ